jgi:hypothetical protein
MDFVGCENVDLIAAGVENEEIIEVSACASPCDSLRREVLDDEEDDEDDEGAGVTGPSLERLLLLLLRRDNVIK